MKKNIGSIDKIVRLVIASTIAILFLTETITGTLGVILLIIAAALIITSVVNFCGLYTLLGINTCPNKKK